jgi:GTP-binding nuclear protein Ran
MIQETKEITIPTFKIPIIGDYGVGKSTFIKRHHDSFQKKYIPNMTSEVHSIKFKTNKGPIIFNLWDSCGSEKFGGVRDAFFLNSDAVILMFDLSSRISYKNLIYWYKDILRICNSIPIVLVGTNVEKRKIKSKQISFHKKKN